MRRRLVLALTALSLLTAGAARAEGPNACLDAIAGAERRAAWLPPGLLASIALTESGYRPPGTRAFVPWPWTINSTAGSFYLDSKREAVAKVETLKRQGVTNIDVGCMQINLQYHPDAFRSLDDAFRPESNVGYAVRFLGTLQRSTPTLFDAVGRYHSATPGRSEAYARKVFARWDKGGEAVRAASEHGLGEPASRRIIHRPPAEIAERAPTRVWRSVYGNAGAASTSGGAGSGSLAGRAVTAEPTQPRLPGQIGWR